MERTARQLAAAIAPSGWYLEKAPKGPRRERWRWRMVHAASGSELTCEHLSGVESVWKELCRVQQVVDARARLVASWLDQGNGPEPAFVETWLSGDGRMLSPHLVEALSACPPPPLPVHWFQQSARMTTVCPPGHHRFADMVRAQLSLIQKAALDDTLVVPDAPVLRRRL